MSAYVEHLPIGKLGGAFFYGYHRGSNTWRGGDAISCIAKRSGFPYSVDAIRNNYDLHINCFHRTENMKRREGNKTNE